MAWYFTHVCFVRETKNRLDTFSITLLGIPFVNVLSILTRGIGQILADALLVGAEIHILNVTVQEKLMKTVRSGVLTIF